MERSEAEGDDAAAVADLFVIGGGINGCGIARDAAGRGLSVTLAEMGDLAQATSSASTKLFHGGLRYLEYFEFRLVREALVEREVLLRAMPHIAWPMRFVLPYAPEMRFEAETPTSRLLSWVMPWMKGKRPRWLIRLGLFMYDHLGGRKNLPGTTVLKLAGTPEGAVLRPGLEMAFEYSDAWVQDARLVVLNARDAAARGAKIMTRCKVISARRAGEIWEIETESRGARQIHRARCLVNAGGPWVGEILHDRIPVPAREGVRLVRGSHIVTRKLYDHDKCYFLQGRDGRIIFLIPYEGEFTLIGTTDAEHSDPDTPPRCTEEERDYLLDFANSYLAAQIGPGDVVWTYSGVRPLYDDGATSATAATRDYVLSLHGEGGAPLLNIFGGKITTYRRLAEHSVEKIAPFFPGLSGAWTAGAPLPGGDFPVEGVAALRQEIARAYPFLAPGEVLRLSRAYGSEVRDVLGAAKTREELGRDFGAGLSEREVTWLMEREFAQSGDDVLWRRGKLGLHLSDAQAAALQEWMEKRLH